VNTLKSLVTILISKGFLVVTYFHASKRDVYGVDITAIQKLAVHGMNASNASLERGASVHVEPKKLVISMDTSSYP
jgi:hypothetical protein